MRTVASVVAIAFSMLILDAIWLTARAPMNRAVFAAIQGAPLDIQWLPAALCYIVMITGVWFFTSGASTILDAATNGAALGAVVYGTYDLTMWATLKRYPASAALADWAWGIFLFASAGAAGFYAKALAFK